ncbi:transposon ty3-I gag-pol polyprotein [Tanacetum coccineum]
MSELRCNLFVGTDDEDAHEHVRKVFEITDLFHILGTTRDAVMLRVFPITLTGGVHPTNARSLKEDDKVVIKKELVPFDESTTPSSQFPRYLKEQEDEAQAFRTLESLKKLKINRSLIRVVKQMPEYLMYVKDVFSSKKPIVEMEAVRLNNRCTTVLQNQLPPRENDPGSFTLPYLIGSSNIRSAFVDLEASINVMPFSMFKKLQIRNLQLTNMMVEMADKSKKAPKGIIENVLVQINKFIFSVDFVVIDMVEDHNVPLILGRPFLETAYAHIDIFNRHISLRVGEERVYFKITEPMDDP